MSRKQSQPPGGSSVENSPEAIVAALGLMDMRRHEIYLQETGDDSLPIPRDVDDPELAKAGLLWLKQQFREPKDVKNPQHKRFHQEVTDTLLWQRDQPRIEEYRRRLAAERAEMAEQTAKEAKAEAKKPVNRNKAEILKRHNEAKRQELDEIIASIEEEHPEGVDPDSPIFQLISLMYASVDSRGNIKLKEHKGFVKEFERQIEAILEHPSQILGFERSRAFIERKVSADNQESSLRVYVDSIAERVYERFLRVTYKPKDFTPSIINEWLSILDDVPNDFKEQVVSGKAGDDPKTRFGIASVHGLIFTNTLMKILLEQPEQFIDSCYMFAREAFNPVSHAKDAMAIAVFKRLTDRTELFEYILRLGMYRVEDLDLRVEMVDLYNVLLQKGDYFGESQGDQELKLSKDEERAFYEIYSSIFEIPKSRNDVLNTVSPFVSRDDYARTDEAIGELNRRIINEKRIKDHRLKTTLTGKFTDKPVSFVQGGKSAGRLRAVLSKLQSGL